MKIKRAVSFIAFACLLACPLNAMATKIGIALTTQNDQRQYKDGPEIKKMLENAGFEAVLYYGGDSDVPIQQRQLKRLITQEHCDLLIVAPIDDRALADALKDAERAKVPVIAYGKLIRGSDAVKYLVSFDSAAVGRMQAESVVSALNLGMRNDSVNIEIFAGPKQDSSSQLIFDGIEEVMSRYLYDGEALIPSKENDLTHCSIANWDKELAMKRMDSLVAKEGYGPAGKKLHAVISASDTITDGILASLKRNGFANKDLPFLTGMDGSLVAIKGIADGERGSSVYRDPRTLHEAVVKMVSSIVKGETPETNNVAFDGDREIPAYYCQPVLIDKTNVEEIAKRINADSGGGGN